MRLFWIIVVSCVLCVFVISAAANHNSTRNNLLSVSSSNKNEENKIQRGNIIPSRPQWATVSLDTENGVKHDVDLASIQFSTYNKFAYIHRIEFRAPIEMSNVKIQFIFAISIADCSTWTSRTVSDIEYLGREKVGNNMFVDKSDTVPQKGSVNDLILTHACKLRDKILI